MAGVALHDIPTCFITSKAVLYNRCATFARFSEDDLHPPWHAILQAQHFRDLHVRFTWQARHLRRRVASWLPQAVSKFRGRRGILCHVMKIDGCLAQNIVFQVANF